MDEFENGVPDLSKGQLESLADIRYALRRFLRFSELAAEDSNLSSQQYLALLAIQGIRGRDWATVGELAERLQIKHHSVVGLVDRMEKQNLVVREQDPIDLRQVRVSTTPLGLKLVNRIAVKHARHWQTIGPELLSIIARILSETAPVGTNSAQSAHSSDASESSVDA